ncbi:PAS domain-containing protein [Helicobacter cynogastricus]|uniref:OMP1488 n=1 Tax=Helicobacter cynogastricus TaxID=329937 RepID=A0A1R3UHZ9_9HELI|nr:PAS domain-containing protein [Helicobacter cynogastricus]SFZ72180.1 OMP1488 [Helicobacter cynogastricus]
MERFVNENAFLVSKTNPKGVITYANQPFVKIVGARERDLLGKPHNIIRHPDMPKLAFKYLWERISAKQEASVFVKNKTLDGSFYWVFAIVTASLGVQGEIVGYYSVRRRPNMRGIKEVAPLYDSLLKCEKKGGIRASADELERFLAQEKMSLEQFMHTLQRL